MQNRRMRKGAGMAVVERALAKVVPQLALAQSAAMPLDIGLANDLAEVLNVISELQKRVAKAQRCDAAASRGGEDVDA